jgi:hypothetical protein
VLCKIYRWKVSGAIDSGKPMSDAVKRHLLRCASCREFAAAAEDVGRRLSRDAGVLMAASDQAFAESIKASLGSAQLQGDPRVSPGRAAVEPKPRSRRKTGFRPSPILATAAALVVVGAGVLWVSKSRPKTAPDLTPPFQIEQPGKYLVAAAERVNSPYAKEMRLWKETLGGAAEKLKQSFDLGLGETQ